MSEDNVHYLQRVAAPGAPQHEKRESAELIEMGAHDRMTPEQALGLSLREAERGQWKCVIALGEDDDGGWRMRSSAMHRSKALWLAEKLRLFALGFNID